MTSKKSRQAPRDDEINAFVNRDTDAEVTRMREEMGKVILAGLILVAGGLAPLFWLNPWRYSQEKREIFQILRRHPKIQLKALEVLNGKKVTEMILRFDRDESSRPAHALLLKVSVPFDAVEITLFRREVKDNPVLSKTFPDPIFELDTAVWHAYDFSKAPYPPAEACFLFLPRAK
jgi:hypothetical protein